MQIAVRLETENDYQKVEHLTREAFWDVYQPGCSEHLVAHNLRNHKDFIPELDLVAVVEEADETKIVGNIMYSKGVIVDRKNQRHPFITCGPISVLPDYQRMGVGKLLLEFSLQKAKELGHQVVFLIGNPQYYQRFGFQAAENFSVTNSDGTNFPAFMLLELVTGSLTGISGRYIYSAGFAVDEQELSLFEQQFPTREKHVLDSQL